MGGSCESGEEFPRPPAGKAWPSTPWGLVRAARDGEGVGRFEALDRLIRTYYEPVRSFLERVLRIRGEELRDVTQGFFASILERDTLRKIHHETSLRSFLKTVCRRYYLNLLRAESARKPRGGRKELSLDALEGALGGLSMPADLFEQMIDEELRAWYLREALVRLEQRLKAAGREAHLAVFQARIRFDGSRPNQYDDVARELGLTVFDVRNRLVLARGLFREILLAIAVERSDDPRGELRELGLLTYIC